MHLDSFSNREKQSSYLKSSTIMQFFVKSLSGQTVAVNVQAGDNINNVKSMIQEREGKLQSC